MYLKTAFGARAQISGYWPRTVVTKNRHDGYAAIEIRYDDGQKRDRDSDVFCFEREEDRDACLRAMDHGEIFVLDPATLYGAVRFA